MSSVNLTEGAISMLARGDVQATEIKPVLQVSDVRLVNTQNQNSNNERYRILLSDGLFLQQAMLATQKNELVRTDKLQKGSIVQLTEFVCNVIQTRMWVRNYATYYWLFDCCLFDSVLCDFLNEIGVSLSLSLFCVARNNNLSEIHVKYDR